MPMTGKPEIKKKIIVLDDRIDFKQSIKATSKGTYIPEQSARVVDSYEINNNN